MSSRRYFLVLKPVKPGFGHVKHLPRREDLRAMPR
jgi:hypothetical protein